MQMTIRLKRFLCFSLFYIFNLSFGDALFAQRQEIEHFKKQIDSLEASGSDFERDEFYIDRVLKTAFSYYSVKPDSCFWYAERAFSLAKAIEHNVHVGTALSTIGIGHYATGRFDSAAYYFEESRQVYEKAGHEDGLLKSLNLLGVAHDLLNQQDKALRYYEDAMEIALAKNDSSFVAALKNNIAEIHYGQGNYKDALELQMEIIRIHEARGEKTLLSLSYNNVANLFYVQRMYDDAMNFFQKSLNIRTEIGDLRGRSATLSNMGNIYFEQKQMYDTAEAYFLESLEIKKDINHPAGMFMAYFNLCRLYIETNKLDKVHHYLAEMEGLPNLNESEKNKMHYYEIKASLAYAEKRYRDVLKPAHKSYELSKKTDQKLDVNRITRLLTFTYAALGQSEKALHYLSEYEDSFDELRYDGINKALDFARASYDFEQRENALIQEQREKDLQNEAQIARQRLVSQTFLAAIIVLIILIGSVIMRERQKRKANKLLEQKNSEIVAQAAKLRELNIRKDMLFSIIGHDLRSPVFTLKSFIDLVQNNDLSSEDFHKYAPELSQNIDNTIDLLENLLQWAQIESKQKTTSFEQININEIIEKNVQLYSSVAKKKKIEIILPENKEVKMYGNTQMISLIIRNLLANALKFTYPKGSISFTMEKIKNYTKICIRDTGVGMTEAQINKILNANASSLKGTDDERGTGLGLIFCIDFIKAHNGELSIDSKEGEGSTFCILFPERKSEMEMKLTSN